MESAMPIFVKVDDYRDILEVVKLLEAKIEQAKSMIAKINELKNEEDTELDSWQQELAELESKFETISKTLLEPGC